MSWILNGVQAKLAAERESISYQAELEDSSEGSIGSKGKGDIVVPLALVDDGVYVCFLHATSSGSGSSHCPSEAAGGSLTVLSGKLDRVDAAEQRVAAVQLSQGRGIARGTGGECLAHPGKLEAVILRDQSLVEELPAFVDAWLGI